MPRTDPHRPPTTPMRVTNSIPDVGDAVNNGLAVSQNASKCLFVMLRREQVQLLARQRPELWDLSIAVDHATIVKNVLAHGFK